MRKQTLTLASLLVAAIPAFGGLRRQHTPSLRVQAPGDRLTQRHHLCFRRVRALSHDDRLGR